LGNLGDIDREQSQGARVSSEKNQLATDPHRCKGLFYQSDLLSPLFLCRVGRGKSLFMSVCVCGNIFNNLEFEA
jgi:hypothetical protein